MNRSNKRNNLFRIKWVSKISIAILLSFSFCSHAQHTIPPPPIPVAKKTHTIQSNDTISKDSLTLEKPTLKTSRKQYVNIGYDENYQKLPKLIFETADEAEFLSLEQQKYIETFKPEGEGNYFYIQTRLKKHKFKKYNDYGGKLGWSGYEFSGYYPATKLYAITEHSTSENLNFSQLFLLDSMNGYNYNIISFGDASVALPVPSINNKYFVYFYNAVYDHKNCDIGILKINDKSNPKTYLSEYASYRSADFAVEKIIWKTDNSFFVKGYEEVYENNQWIKKYKYFKTEFK